jgi:hypothetical protein
MEEWEKYMSDFVPEDINTIVMPPSTESVNIFHYISFQIPNLFLIGFLRGCWWGFSLHKRSLLRWNFIDNKQKYRSIHIRPN